MHSIQTEVSEINTAAVVQVGFNKEELNKKNAEKRGCSEDTESTAHKKEKRKEGEEARGPWASKTGWLTEGDYNYAWGFQLEICDGYNGRKFRRAVRAKDTGLLGEKIAEGVLVNAVCQEGV